jgi:hypothetical protein
MPYRTRLLRRFLTGCPLAYEAERGSCQFAWVAGLDSLCVGRTAVEVLDLAIHPLA